MTAGMVNSGAGDASVTSFDLGTVFTVAFSADITVSKNTVLQSSVTNSMIGLDLGSVTIASGGSASNLSFTQSGYGLHRWVITRNTNQYYIYRDGVQVASQNTAILGSLTQFDRVFRGDYPYNTYTTAKYGEIFISSDAKSASWVTDDWTLASRPGWNGKYYYTSESNITHLWHFDEGSGTSATDLVGGNTITIPTPTWSTGILCAELKRRVDTTGSGDFSFTGVDSMYGTPALFFINGETVKGALLTNLTEGTTAVTGVTMEQDTMVIGDTNLNPLVSYASAFTIASTAITDYCFRATSNVLYYRDGCDLLVPTGCTYTGTQIIRDSGETGTITIDGTLTAITKLISDTAINLNGTMPGGDVQVGGSTTCDVTVTSDCHLTSYGSDVVRDLTVTSPADCQCSAFVLKGDLTSSGTFFSSSLSLQGTSQTITNTGTFSTGYFSPCATVNLFGDMTIGYFTNPSAQDISITFEHGKTYELGNFEDTGSSPGHEMHFRSDVPGSRYTIDNISGGPLTTFYIDVQDSNVSTNDFNAKRSVDSGNTDKLSATPHWVFWEYQKGFRLNHN
jgi:hypothetical protein